MQTWIVADRTLEFIEYGHIYLVDGVIVPSITGIVRKVLGEKYDRVPRDVLNKASEHGTAVHAEIASLGDTEDESKITFDETRNFLFLKRHYGFSVVENEVPLILFDKDEPIAAGQCDLVLIENGMLVGADMKTTSSLDRHYLSAQLNLYRRAYEQSYGKRWELLKGIWLRKDKRKYVDIPIDDEWVDEVIRSKI